MKNTRDYPKCDHHEVRCPQCGRSLADRNPHVYPMEHAKHAKHCGAPCYGTAWYTYTPAVRHEYLNYAAQPVSEMRYWDRQGSPVPGVPGLYQRKTFKFRRFTLDGKGIEEA
jgi:hypothetical protein